MTLDEKVDLILGEMHGLREDVNELKEDVSSLKEETSSIKSEVKELTKRVDKLENTTDLLRNDVGVLKNGQMQMNQELQIVSQRVTMTYDLALENWGDIVESKVRLKVLEQDKQA